MLHNMCIIFLYNIQKQEWMREVTNDVHKGLAIARVQSTSIHERLAVAKLALHSLANIDNNLRETHKYIKQEATMKFEIAMGTGDKTFKEFCARQNNIAKNLWMAKTKTCIAQTFPLDNVYENIYLEFFNQFLHCLVHAHE